MAWRATQFLQGVNEGWQKQLAITKQHDIKEWGQRFRVGGQHWSAAEDDWIAIAPFMAPQRDSLLFQKI